MAALAQIPISRLLLTNTSVLVLVFVFLAITPAPVTFPEDSWETAFLLKGALLLLAANIAAIRLRSEPRPRRAPRTTTLSDALIDLHRLEHHHVRAEEGVIGIVDEVVGDRHGRPVGLLLVEHSWFKSRRYLVPLADVHEIDEDARTITIRDGSAATGS